MNNNYLYNHISLKPHRRRLRKNLPPAERLLWSRLRHKQLQGLRFRRQYSVNRYILDFYCPSRRLAIELDGQTHVIEADKERDSYLRGLNIKVVRFSNREVYTSLEAVLETIVREVTSP